MIISNNHYQRYIAVTVTHNHGINNDSVIFYMISISKYMYYIVQHLHNNYS